MKGVSSIPVNGSGKRIGLEIANPIWTMSQASRQHPRFPVRMPVLCEGPTVPGYNAVGLTHNVSQGGLMLETVKPLAPGTATNLRLLVGDGIARAEAAVVWKTDSPPCQMGLRFTMMEGADRLAWEKLLASQAGPTPRGSVRISMSLEVTCRVDPDTCLAGRVENLSDSGMMIVLPRTMPPQTRVSVIVPSWLILPPVEAEVMWNRSGSGRDDVLHGVRFLADHVGREFFLIGALLRGLLN
ncbi:MAG: PilZ domain-containing protein [Candidatus Methylomirabilales bacterium]